MFSRLRQDLNWNIWIIPVKSFVGLETVDFMEVVGLEGEGAIVVVVVDEILRVTGEVELLLERVVVLEWAKVVMVVAVDGWKVVTGIVTAEVEFKQFSPDLHSTGLQMKI